MRLRRIWYVLALIGLVGASMVTQWSVAEAQTADAESPVAHFGYGPHPPQVGETVSFVNLSVGGVSHQWDFGDGFDSEERNPTHRYEDSGPHEVVLTACGSDATTCTEYVSTIWVQTAGRERRPMASDFAVTPTNPQADETTTLTADNRSRVSLWRIPELGIASEPPGSSTLDVVFPSPGSYLVEHLLCWTSSDSLRCDRTERTITVDSDSAGPTPQDEPVEISEISDEAPQAVDQGTTTSDEEPANEPANSQVAVRVAPANVVYDGFLGAPASLRWTDTNQTEVAYRVYATRNDLIPEEVGLRVDAPAGATGAKFFEFASAYGVVCYEVRAVFSDGSEGPPSAETCHAQPGRIAQADEVAVTPGAASGSVDVRWTAEVSNTLRFWLCTSAATYTDSVAIGRDEFTWEIVDGERILRGYDRTLYGMPGGETVTVEVHPDPINGGRCLGTGVSGTTTVPEPTSP